jgi:hypothetical protein
MPGVNMQSIRTLEPPSSITPAWMCVSYAHPLRRGIYPGLTAQPLPRVSVLVGDAVSMEASFGNSVVVTLQT